MLAPDPALATLPISVMVLGMWIGTLAGRDVVEGLRPPLCAAGRLGFRRPLRPCFLRGGAAGLVCAVACRHTVRRPLRCGASILSLRRCRYGERPVPAQGGGLGACRRRVCRVHRIRSSSSSPRMCWPPYLFAGTYLAQSACAVLAAGVLTLLEFRGRGFLTRWWTDGRCRDRVASRNSSLRSSAVSRATR